MSIIVSFILGMAFMLLIFLAYNFALKLLLSRGNNLIKDGNQIKEEHERIAVELYNIEKELWPQG